MLGRTLLSGACLGLVVTVPAPQGGPPAPTTVTSVAYADGVALDEHMPARVRDDAPVVVLVHGCCGDRRDMAGLARALARRGAVVVNADVHPVAAGGGWPTSYHEVVCAVSTARGTAAELGGHHHRVVVLGWSDGAMLAAAATLGWPELASGTTTCRAPISDRAPDVLVGLGGFYGWGDPGVPASMVTEATVAWFGTSPEVDPRPWKLGNPMWWLSQRQVPHVPPVHLIAARNDAASTVAFRRQLAMIGADVSMTTVDSTNHLALVQPRDDEGAAALAAICAVLDLPVAL
jgi:acetyl esterase/lipase